MVVNVSKKFEDEPKASEEMDELEANFVRRLKRGTKKYKVKLPIGYYASRCMYKEDYKRSDNDKRKDRYKSSDKNKKINDI